MRVHENVASSVENVRGVQVLIGSPKKSGALSEPCHPVRLMVERKENTMSQAAFIETHVIFILDRSGSMEPCAQQTISGFNENVQQMRRTAKESGMEDHTFVTLVQFNDEVAFTHFAAPVHALADLSAETYQTGSTTAMFDAVGLALHRFKREIEDSVNHRYLVTIFSDGEENASKEYRAADIAGKVKRRLATNRWTFNFIGANQDLSRVAEQTAIPRSNMVDWRADAGGTRLMFSSYSESMATYLSHSYLGGKSMVGIPRADDSAIENPSGESSGEPPDDPSGPSSANPKNRLH